MDKPVISGDSSIEEKLAAIRAQREKEKVTNNEAVVSPSPATTSPTPTETKKKILKRIPKDIHFEGYDDLHYIIKNIAGRHKRSFAELACELLEDSLKRKFNGEYKEFLELHKKLHSE
jgi:hypothetical protein